MQNKKPSNEIINNINNNFENNKFGLDDDLIEKK